MFLADPSSFLMPPRTPAPDRPEDGPLDPVALAWYRHRLATGHYDADEVMDRVVESLERTRLLEAPPPPPAP